MRFIAVFLVLVNLTYAGWALVRPATGNPEGEDARPLLNTGITLISEFAAQSEALAQEPPRQAARCTRVAGFDNLDDAHGLIAAARERGLQAQLELTGTPLPSQYRVYLPPASSRAIAAITLDGLSERLQDADLRVETYLVTRGLLENSIALGVFNQRENAVGVRNSVRELGYDPQMEEIPRSDGDILVWLQGADSEPLDDPEWLDLSVERPTLSRSENLCQTIAQASQFP